MSSTIGLSLRAAAVEVPDRPALISAGRCFTFGELDARVRRLRAFLVAEGFAPAADSSSEAVLSHRVAVLGESRLETLILSYALIELGIPILMVHPRLSQAERDDLLRQSKPRFYFGDPTIGVWIRRAASPDAKSHSLEAVPEIDPENCLAIVRTSGSSGLPKGVLLSRRAFFASAQAGAERLGWREDDRWLLSLPLAHVGGLSIVTRCLIARRTVVIPPWTRFRAEAVRETLVRDRITLLSLVPTMLRRLLTTGAPPSALRATLIGGAAASPALLNDAVDRGWSVLTTYGLTESCSQLTLQFSGTSVSDSDDDSVGDRGCGPPLIGTEIRTVDGVIEIRGPTLMSGYFPPQDARAFTADGWLRTSDLGWLDEAGHLHLKGRQDDVIISGGENVSPLEVERVLEGHPAVAEAVVWGIEDEEWGQVVAAAVVWHPALREASRRAEDTTLEKWIMERLAPHARPRFIAALDSLPRNPTGKVDRRRAAELAGARIAD